MLQIKLIDTLSDFFARESRVTDTSSPCQVFISYNPISDTDLAATLPRNTKYLIQQWRSSGTDSLGSQSPVLNLVLMPQRMSWICGKMDVIFFKPQHSPEDIAAEAHRTLEEDLEETIRVLEPGSRFKPNFCCSLEHICQVVGDSMVMPYLPSDGLERLPHYNDPDSHYRLLSKRALAISNLPTPKAEVLDVSRSVTDRNTEIIEAEIGRAIHTIRHHDRPFVLKSNLAGGSKGTYIIHTPEDHQVVISDLGNILRIEFPRLNTDNAHLNPCSLIFTEFLPGPPATSVNFYVGSDKHVWISSVCLQTFSETGHWLGGSITYSAQDRLKENYTEICEKAANFLYDAGYRGPVGIDVMIDTAGQHCIVDLNPRPTGTFVLGCLREHFAHDLGFDKACVLPYMEFRCSRVDFKNAFEKQIEKGELLVLTWYTCPKRKRSFACFAVGAKSMSSLARLCEDIETWATRRSE